MRQLNARLTDETDAALRKFAAERYLKISVALELLLNAGITAFEDHDMEPRAIPGAR